MGNRVYLELRGSNLPTLVEEDEAAAASLAANNSLPLFWLALLQKENLDITWKNGVRDAFVEPKQAFRERLELRLDLPVEVVSLKVRPLGRLEEGQRFVEYGHHLNQPFGRHADMISLDLRYRLIRDAAEVLTKDGLRHQAFLPGKSDTRVRKLHGPTSGRDGQGESGLFSGSHSSSLSPRRRSPSASQCAGGKPILRRRGDVRQSNLAG